MLGRVSFEGCCKKIANSWRASSLMPTSNPQAIPFWGVISSTRSSQVLCASLDATTVLRVITPHDREGSEVSFQARHERAFLFREDEKNQKWSCLSLYLRHFVRSWGVCAPLLRLYSG